MPVPHRSRPSSAQAVVLLLVSSLFYAALEPTFVGLLFFSAIVNYFLARGLRRTLSAGRLWLGVAFNLLLLSFFKYLPLAGGIPALQGQAPWLSELVLPLGISFWSFQAISYLIDIYREEDDVDASLVELCLYLAFAPTVISGPICRMSEMLPQFRRPLAMSWNGMGEGTQRIVVGLGMMIVSQFLATGIGPGQGVDAGFGRDPNTLGGFDVWAISIGYGFQLFLNFAGYSHVAIGVARLLGIRLRENFDEPFLSASPSEFWTRWHMSLSSWIRDYVFFPLATLSPAMRWRSVALIVTMALFGLWHKGSVLFLMWGVYHGLLLVAHRHWGELAFVKRRTRDGPMFVALSTFVTLAAVSIGWIFFRSADVQQAGSMLTTLASPSAYARFLLPANFYRLLVVVALGYFAVIALGRILDRYDRVPRGSGVAVRPFRGVLVACASNRWVWVGPIIAVASLYALLTIRLQGSIVGPMMYQVF